MITANVDLPHLSQMIISKMNGSIKVTSQPGMGSSFVITIPVTISDEPLTRSAKQADKSRNGDNSENRREIVNLPVLIGELEGKYMKILKTFETRQPLGEVRLFGRSLIEPGNRHNCSLISDYGRELSKSADGFDIEVMLKLLKNYHETIDGLKRDSYAK